MLENILIETTNTIEVNRMNYMEYMEIRAQDQIEASLNHEAALQGQFDSFCAWYLAIPDADESLVDRKFLSASYDLISPVPIVSAMWQGWRAANGI